MLEACAHVWKCAPGRLEVSRGIMESDYVTLLRQWSFLALSWSNLNSSKLMSSLDCSQLVSASLHHCRTTDCSPTACRDAPAWLSKNLSQAKLHPTQTCSFPCHHRSAAPHRRTKEERQQTARQGQQNKSHAVLCTTRYQTQGLLLSLHRPVSAPQVRNSQDGRRK